MEKIALAFSLSISIIINIIAYFWMEYFKWPVSQSLKVIARIKKITFFIFVFFFFALLKPFKYKGNLSIKRMSFMSLFGINVKGFDLN